jgi:hypothetical protein
MDELEAQRRKLMRLFYDDRIGADLFAEEEARLTKTIAAARDQVNCALEDVQVADDLSRTFDEVVSHPLQRSSESRQEGGAPRSPVTAMVGAMAKGRVSCGQMTDVTGAASGTVHPRLPSARSEAPHHRRWRTLVSATAFCNSLVVVSRFKRGERIPTPRADASA